MFKIQLQTILVCTSILFKKLLKGESMFVCVCNQVSDKQIHAAVDSGVRKIESIYADLNVGSCCGKCKDCAAKVLSEAIREKCL